MCLRRKQEEERQKAEEEARRQEEEEKRRKAEEEEEGEGEGTVIYFHIDIAEPIYSRPSVALTLMVYIYYGCFDLLLKSL